jgi:hypothetical protein
MARKRGAKTAAVREMLTQDPEMPTDEVVSTLAARRMKITPHMVHVVRSALKAKKPTTRKGVSSARGGWTADAVELVVKVKALSSEAGGMENLKQLVVVLAD